MDKLNKKKIDLKKIFQNKTFQICFFLFALTFLVFIFRFRHFPTPDVIPNDLLPIAIIYNHTLDLNVFVCRLDRATQTFKYSPSTCYENYWWTPINGRAISSYPIIPGLMNLPAYYIAYLFGINLFKNIGLLSTITSAFISALSVVFMFLVLEEICKKRKTAVYFSLIYAFCTLVWSIASNTLWQHGPSLLLINISLYILYKKNPKWLPWVGLFLGLAVFNRPTNLFIVVPLAVYFLFNHRKYFWQFCATAAIPLALLLWYSYYYMGSITGLGQTQALVMKGNFINGFLGLLFSPARGLFVFSPIFLLSLLYIPKIFSKKEEKITKYIFIFLLLIVLAYSGWVKWYGGWSFGYRLITESIPVWMILLVKSWTEIISKNKVLIAVFIILLMISFYFNLLGAQMAPCGFDSFPNDIDWHTERLWQIKDTELIRCNDKLGGSIIETASQFFRYLKNNF